MPFGHAVLLWYMCRVKKNLVGDKILPRLGPAWFLWCCNHTPPLFMKKGVRQKPYFCRNASTLCLSCALSCSLPSHLCISPPSIPAVCFHIAISSPEKTVECVPTQWTIWRAVLPALACQLVCSMIAGAHDHPWARIFSKIRVGIAWRCARLSPLLLCTRTLSSLCWALGIRARISWGQYSESACG